jgi:hypothetical protein
MATVLYTFSIREKNAEGTENLREYIGQEVLIASAFMAPAHFNYQASSGCPQKAMNAVGDLSLVILERMPLLKT